MNKILNEKGSLPLVLVIVFMLGMSALGLSGLLASEKITYKYSVVSDMKAMYKTDSIIEMTINVSKQLLYTKEYTEVDKEEIIKNVDLFQIEDIVNADIVPLYYSEGKIYLEKIYFPPTLDTYCEKFTDGNNNVTGYKCEKESFHIEYKIYVQEKGHLDEYKLRISNIYPVVSQTNDYIYLNLENITFQLFK